MSERWARTAGFPAYEISTSGRVRQRHTGKHLSIWANDEGYLYVNLQRAGEWKKPSVHMLVWKTFRGPPGDHQVDHRDRNRGNPRLGNLRLATASQQQAWALRGNSRTSRYRGVAWQKGRRAWSSSIRQNRRTRWLGRFKSERAAALAYDTAARRMFGKFAVLNFGARK